MRIEHPFPLFSGQARGERRGGAPHPGGDAGAAGAALQLGLRGGGSALKWGFFSPETAFFLSPVCSRVCGGQQRCGS